MCDYSLHFVASRPARVGEQLVSMSFPRRQHVVLRRSMIVTWPCVYSLAPSLRSRKRCDAMLALFSLEPRAHGGEVPTGQQGPVKHSS